MQGTTQTVSNRFRVACAAAAAVSTALLATPVVADTTLKVYRSHMPDGTIVLGDKPAAGAKSVDSSTYVMPQARQRDTADAERDYWRRQSEAFDQRQMRRDAMSGGTSRQWSTRGDGPGPIGYREQGDPFYYGGHVARPLVSLNQVPQVYRSSPGAVRGRDSGFIGSGFSTSR